MHSPTLCVSIGYKEKPTKKKECKQMDVNQNLHDALRVNGLNWEHVRDNLDIEDVSNEEHAAVKNFVSNVEDKFVEKICFCIALV